MPKYDYRCLECGHTFEVSHGMNDDPPTVCVGCAAGPLQRLISAPRINSLQSTSPTGAKYERLTKQEIIDQESEPLAEMEKQEGMAEKLAIMYGGKLD